METTSNRNFGAMALIAVGAFFLGSQILGINIWSFLADLNWPLFILLPGAFMLFVAITTTNKKQMGLAIPGSVVAGTGALMWLQNLFNYWESWAYAWAVYPVLVGIGLIIFGTRAQKDEALKTGQGMVKYGGVALIGITIFFEFLINDRFGGMLDFAQYLLPLGFIGAGVYLLKRDPSPRDAYMPLKAKRKNAPPPFGAHVIDPATHNVIDPDLQRKIDAALAEEDDAALQ